MKGTCYDWFPLRPEFCTQLEFVLGRMCLSRQTEPGKSGNAPGSDGQPPLPPTDISHLPAEGASDAGLLVFLTRKLPMEDIKIREFRQYAKWRWNSMKYCPFCSSRLVGLFTRSCPTCHRDVKKLKV